MKKTLAKALWAFTLTSFTVSACNSNHQAAPKAGADPSAVVANNQPIDVDGVELDQAATEGEASPHALAEPLADRKEMAASDKGSVQASARARPAGVLGGKQQYAPMPLQVAQQQKIAVPPSDLVPSGEDYKDYGKNPMVSTAIDHLSTFAVDVDTASYAIARRKIVEGQLPPSAAVRVEEFVNYFKYDYAAPAAGSRDPFAVHMDMAPSPFHKGRQIVRVGVKAKELSLRDRKKANLVFLVDVSGSMQSPDKLELAKRSLRVLVDNLKDGDTVSLVTYAGSTRVVLSPTGLEHKAEIISALEDLQAGGSTAMSSGMDLAYELAAKTLTEDSISRVIVLSDGDANIGASSHDQILKTIAGKVKEGVTLSTVGFGMGNYKDQLMEQLANKGNGNYFYIDSPNQARRVFQEQLGSALEVVAKDVKIQVDFDKEVVKSYRLIGYENRDIADQDFRNDQVDAGEIGAGHVVTALYEVELSKRDASPLTVRIRAKAPRGSKALESAFPFDNALAYQSFDGAPEDFRFASAVMGAAEILRGSEEASDWTLEQVLQIASSSAEAHAAEREEFISLIKSAQALRNTLARR